MSFGETPVTVVGNLTADPEIKFTEGGAALAKFTIATTPRVFDRESNQGKDGTSRQGEVFGVPVDAVGSLTGWLHDGLQIKVVTGRALFGKPKNNKVRDVPLPDSVAQALTQHMQHHPPVDVTLPWKRPDGPPVTKRLIFSGPKGNHVYRSNFDISPWKPALATAGPIDKPEDGAPLPSAREHGMHALRHFYAFVLLDAGENIKTLNSYLGHTDPGFTPRVCTHLMPSSESRTRRAIDTLCKSASEGNEAQAA
ncbi:single-stranded DNA-binding protein [Streptomyces venezuelae]|uniref:single-stranded DNA-binding protein n=1 Tax=Streptomyces venezuelae TaxID=54571 RepID=UPI002958CF93|nr:single-stranded DNA-binding protein [Streptomyces venezuelae]